MLLGLLLCTTACSPSGPTHRAPTPLATPTSSAVQPAAGPSVQREQARALWNAHGPAHYRFVWSTSAMVGQTRVLIEVRDRRVVSTEALHDDDRRVARVGRTVEDLFTELADEQRDADAVTVTYDPALGYPAHVQVDEKRNAVDDEHTFAIEDLRAI